MIECKYFSRPRAYTKMAPAGFADYDNSVLFLPPGYVVLDSISYLGICHPKGCEFRSCSSEIRKKEVEILRHTLTKNSNEQPLLPPLDFLSRISIMYRNYQTKLKY